MSARDSIRRWWRTACGPRTIRHADQEELEAIRARRFADADRGEFARLWCEIATICDVDPLKLHEDDLLRDLCPEPLLTFNLKIQELEALVMQETQDLPPPRSRPNTVGEVVDYVLELSGR
jgi:hypothetical protein